MKSRVALVYCLMLGLTLSLVTGCSSTPYGNNQSEAQESNQLTYLDSSRFDGNLKAKLQQDMPEVEVVFLQPPEIAELPSGMNNWLAAVEEHGGSIEVVGQQGQSKSIGAIFTLMKIIKEGRSMVREHQMFKPAKNYDAFLSVSEEDSRVTTVTFKKRAVD